MKLWVVALVWLVGCASEPVCGVDNEDVPLPVCTYELPKDQAIEYCPGDEWGSIDGCNSCACDSDGSILCTSITCPGTAGAR